MGMQPTNTQWSERAKVSTTASCTTGDRVASWAGLPWMSAGFTLAPGGSSRGSQ
jgi:hypothetical protein